MIGVVEAPLFGQSPGRPPTTSKRKTPIRACSLGKHRRRLAPPPPFIKIRFKTILFNIRITRNPAGHEFLFNVMLFVWSFKGVGF